MKHVSSFVRFLSGLGLVVGAHLAAQAQSVGIGTTAPDASAALDIVSSSMGVLLPRVANVTAVASPATGLIVFQTGGTAGYYYNAGTPGTPSWQQLATVAGADITASNGLTKTGQTVALGGTLTGVTTIDQGGNAFSLTGGNVGIGTAAPLQALDVANGGVRVGDFGNFTNVTAANQGAHLQWNRTGGEGETWLINHLGLSTANAGIRFAGITTSTGTVPTEWARFLNNGSFGLGTTAPSALLDVNGSTRLRGLTTAGIVTTDASGNLGSATAASLDASTASNGLTETGTNIALGGALTQATTVALGANNLTFSSTTGTVGIGASSAARLGVRGTGNAYPATTGTTQSVGLIGRFQTNDNTILDLGGNSSNGLWLQSTNITTLALNYPLLLNPNGGNVGVGTTGPLAKLAVNGAQVLYSGLNNASARPAVGTARIAGEIGAVGQVAGTTPDLTADDGFLRLSAGGGGNLARKSYIDLSGFSNNTDMNENIVFGTINAERMRITNTGNVGIGTSTPAYPLDVDGSIHAVTGQGVVLDAQDRPLITRGWDPFTSGVYSGLGRWGMFMESNNLTFGVPALGGKQFQWVTYNANSSITTTPMTLTQGGNLGIGNTAPTSKLTVQTAADADQGLRVTDGTTTGNIVIQPLAGGNTGFSTINYNGYYATGEARFNTGKNRWRLGTDQRGATDRFFIDTYNGTTGITALAITTNGNVGIGTTIPAAMLEVAGYTRLDGPAAITGATVPGIATALFTGNLPTVDNTNVGVSLGGIATSRVLSVSVMALAPNGNYFPPNQSTAIGFGTGYEYGYYLETVSNTLRLAVGTNAANVKNSAAAAVKILVTYQQ